MERLQSHYQGTVGRNDHQIRGNALVKIRRLKRARAEWGATQTAR